MSKCVYELIIGGESYVANSQKELEDYLLNNYDRIVAKLQGVDVNIEPSQSIPHNLSKIAFNFAKIKHEVESRGGVINDYSTELTEKVETPLRKLKSEGFVGVTSHIESKTATKSNGEVKKIILSYDRDKHKEHLVWTYVEKKLGIKATDEELKTLVRDERSRIYNDPTELKQLEKFLKEKFEEYELGNALGRSIHDGLSLAFQEMNRGKELNVDSFTNLNEFNVTHLNMSDNEKFRFQTSLYNLLKNRDNGLYRRLDLENAQYIYSELPIMYENDKGVKLVGIIDLVVVDKKGNIRLFDFKTSLKNHSDWNHAKDFRMTSQLGYYKAMLESKGLNVLDASIIPIEIQMDETKNDPINLKVGDFMSVQNRLLDPSSNNKYKNILVQIKEDIPEEKTLRQLTETESLKIIDNFLKTTLNVSYKDKKSKTDLDKSFEKLWTTSKKKDSLGNIIHTFINPNTGESELLPSDKEKQKNYYIEQKEKHFENSGSQSLLDYVVNTINRYKIERDKEEDLNKKELIPFTFGKGNDIYNVNFNRLFGKYKSDEWSMIPNHTANMLGFILFVNSITKTIDIVSVSNELVSDIHKLPFGTTILGNKLSDFSPRVLEDRDMMKANIGNIELLKIMSFINFNTNFFTAQGYRIGDLKVVNQYNEGTFLSFDSLKKNFIHLIKAYNLESDYFLNDNIQVSNPVENLLLTISAIGKPQYAKILGFDRSMSDFLTKLDKQRVQDERNTEQIKNDILMVLTEELTRRRANKEISSFKNPDQQDWFTKLIADQILYYTDAYHPAFERNLHKFELWTNSIKNIPSAAVGGVQRTLSVAIERIKKNFLQTKEETNRVTYALFEDRGFGKFRRYTIGDHPIVYRNLFERKGDTLDPNLMVKDINDPSLSQAEKTYLKTFLTIINKGRGIEQDVEELSAVGDLNYRKIPLVKLQSLILFKDGDWNTKFQQWINKIYNPAKSIFEGEMTEEGAKIDQFLEMWNSTVLLSPDSEQRTKLLTENDINTFETDLEAVLDVFILTEQRQKAFDDVLPIIGSIKIAAIMNNIGILKEIDPVLDFIDNHLKIVVRGEKLIEGETEKKIDKVGSIMRQFTAIANLVLSPISITREFTQSFYGVLSRASIKMYGKNSHSLKHVAEQLQIVSGKSVADTYQDTNLVESLNVLNGMSNMNLNSMIDRSSTTKTGLPHFFSNHLQGFNRAPEYMVRMTVLIAELIKDDAWKAYSFVNGEIIYDWKKDGRFSIYAQGLKNHPEYQRQKGLYQTLLKEFNSISLDMVYKELPQAYTNRQIESLKHFADSILGYYDPESRIQQQSTLMGAMFMQFSAWIIAIKDKYYMEGHKSQVAGEYILMKDEFGNQIYVTPEGQLTREKGIDNTEAWIWNHKWNEGILQSLLMMYKAAKTGKFENMKNLWEADERLRSNIKLMISDLFYMLIMQLLARILQEVVFGEDLQKAQKEDSSGAISVLNAVLASPADLNPFESVGSFARPQGGWIFPALSYFGNVSANAVNVILGNKGFQTFVFDSFGATRPFRPLLDD